MTDPIHPDAPLPKAPPPGWRKGAAPHRADAKFEP